MNIRRHGDKGKAVNQIGKGDDCTGLRTVSQSAASSKQMARALAERHVQAKPHHIGESPRQNQKRPSALKKQMAFPMDSDACQHFSGDGGVAGDSGGETRCR
jgi:uncharacterized protein (DUF4415 family)